MIFASCTQNLCLPDGMVLGGMRKGERQGSSGADRP